MTSGPVTCLFRSGPHAVRIVSTPEVARISIAIGKNGILIMTMTRTVELVLGVPKWWELLVSLSVRAMVGPRHAVLVSGR